VNGFRPISLFIFISDISCHFFSPHRFGSHVFLPFYRHHDFVYHSTKPIQQIPIFQAVRMVVGRTVGWSVGWLVVRAGWCWLMGWFLQ
jgi:hypothetical protein